MPIKLILDTNVYSSDKLRLGQGFKTLGGLSKGGHVELLLPYIVKREFETQLEASASEIVSGLEKNGVALANGPISDDLREMLDAFMAKLADQKQEVIESQSAHFSAWLEDHAVTVLALNGKHAIAAMENYFSAGPPFQSAKRRQDIPDAMIYQALVNSAEGGPIVFVCNDQKLANAIIGIANITVYKDLNEFIASDDIQAIISEQEAAERATDLLQRLERLASTSPNPLSEFVSEHGGEGLVRTSFSSPSIPGDDREAYIYMFGNLDDIELDWGRAAYHGNMVYVVPFSGEGEFNNLLRAEMGHI